MSQDDSASETAQQRFDRLYISSAEVRTRVGCTRPTIMRARQSGLLPEPICIDGMALFVWERATIEPIISEWVKARNFHKRVNQA